MTQRAHPPGLEAAPPRTASPSRVWLVDDSPAQLEHARKLLSRSYSVETFGDSELMLEQLSLGTPPMLLLLDLHLPGLSGLETCRFVRERYDEVTLPILMLSTRGTHNDFTEGLQAGASDYVAKPYNDEELLARVATLLRVRAQGQQLREREAYLHTTLSSIGDAVITTDAAGHITFLNTVAERLTGWSAAEAERLPLREVFHIISASTRAPLASPVDRALAPGAVQGIAEPALLIRKDGTEVSIEDTAAPILNGPSGTSGAVLVFRDVTESTRARQHQEVLAARLRATEAEQRVLLDAIPVLVSFVDADERYGRVNKAYEEWFGIPANRLRGQKIRDVIGEAAYAVLSPFVRRALAGESFSFEQHSVPYRLGGTRDVKVTFVAHREPGQPVAGYVALLQDITLQRRLEQERAQHAQRLKQQAEFEQQLIGIVSHDLRNPLAAILLGADQLNRKTDLDPLTLRVVRRIHASASRAVRMVKDLLDFTQARLGGGLQITPGLMDLHALGRAVVDEVEAAHPTAKVEVLTSGDATGLWDADRISQVLQNLVTNAVKYGQPGAPIQVEIRGADHQVTLRVHNEGAPIPEERLSALFQPLQRGTQPTDQADRSVGLGLFIVKSIVAAHQGHVDVESALGQGTTFTVTLPRQGVARPVPPGSPS